MDYRKKVFVFGEEKLKKLGNLLKAHLRELFLTTLLTNETVPPERVKRLVKSLGQDIILLAENLRLPSILG